MGQRTRKDTDSGIRVSMSCLADFVTKPGRSAESRLRPFKFSKRGEGFARSSYYQIALRTIRVYHSQGNDPAVLEQALQEMRARNVSATDGRQRAKFQHNARAIEAYRKLYGKRKFKILPNRRLQYPIGGIIVAAQPDLWVEEEGSQVLLKIGMAKHNVSYIDLVLSLLRKAAISGGLKIRAKNFVYLNVSSGQEMVSSGGLTRFNRTFTAAAREIAGAWPKITTEPPPPAGPREARA
jgi:hypothetical protein